MRKGICDRCQRLEWINIIINGSDLIGGKLTPHVEGEFCADCFDKVPHPAARTRRTAGRGKADETGPAYDNAIRAMEDGRS